MTITIGLISNVDPTELKNTKENNIDEVTIYYKKLRIHKISNADNALIIASNSFPFFTKDNSYELEDNPRFAVAVYLNEIYGKNISWQSIDFMSPHFIDLDEISSDDEEYVKENEEKYKGGGKEEEEEEEEEEDDEEQRRKKILEIERATKREHQLHKKRKFFENYENAEFYYDETNANKIVRSNDYLKGCDYIYDYPSIKDPNNINFESIMWVWKEELIAKRNNNEINPTITKLIDDLFRKHPFLEKEISEMDYDYLEKPFLIADTTTTTTTDTTTTTTTTNTANIKTDVKNITNKKVIVISSDSDE